MSEMLEGKLKIEDLAKINSTSVHVYAAAGHQPKRAFVA